MISVDYFILLYFFLLVAVLGGSLFAFYFAKKMREKTGTRLEIRLNRDKEKRKKITKKQESFEYADCSFNLVEDKKEESLSPDDKDINDEDELYLEDDDEN